jgi:hypothetical protein
MRVFITLVLAAICAFILVVGLADSFARQHPAGRTLPLTRPAGEPANHAPANGRLQPLRVGLTPLPLNEAIRLVLERSQEMGS